MIFYGGIRMRSRGRLRRGVQERVVFNTSFRRRVLDLVLHLLEFFFEVLRSATKLRQSFSKRSRELGKFLRAENNQRNSQNQEQLRHSDAKHKVRLCDFGGLRKLVDTSFAAPRLRW